MKLFARRSPRMSPGPGMDDRDMVSSKDALRQSRDNAFARWKGTEISARDRILRKVVVPAGRQSFSTGPRDTFFTIGSCFARNVEEQLEQCGARVLSRRIEMPDLGAESARAMGVFNKYHPHAILQELEFACGVRRFSEDCLLPAGDGLFYDGQLRANAGNAEISALMGRREHIRRFFAQAFEADVLILTLGLVEAWYDRRSGLFLNDAPAGRLMVQDPGRFRFKCLTAAECAAALERIGALLATHSKPGQKVVITVSPVPIGRTFTADDIIVANMTSKSALRVAAMDFASRTGGVDYFPSYEAASYSHPDIAWQGDRLHVSDFLVGEIIRTFLRRCGFDLPGTGEETAEPDLSEDQRWIRKLNREVNAYKNRIVALESRLQAAGLDPD